MRYVSFTKEICIMYSITKDFKLTRYTNSDSGGNLDERKSTYGYIFPFGISVVLWDSKKQTILMRSVMRSQRIYKEINVNAIAPLEYAYQSSGKRSLLLIPLKSW